MKLIPKEDRLKSRAITGLLTRFYIDATTRATTVETESMITYKKEIPDLKIALHILSIYGSLRGICNIENTGIGLVIVYYSKILIK